MTPQLSTGVFTFANEDQGAWEGLVAQVQVLDEVGFDRIVCSDHIVFGEHMEEYQRPEVGGQAGGVQPTGPDGLWLEPLTFLTYAAALTTRVRLGTNILIAALRRPAVLAKAAATLDVLSSGRLDLGVGVGWQREEYEAAGLAFDGRGKALDETLAICQLLWREQRATYSSDTYRFDGIHTMPKPRQEGGVPVWVSGRLGPVVARRLARFGSGWIPWGDDEAHPTESIPKMRELVADLGRDPSELQFVGRLPVVRDSAKGVDIEATMDAVPRLRDAGVTDFRVVLRIPADRAEAVDQLTPFVEAFRAASGS